MIKSNILGVMLMFGLIICQSCTSNEEPASMGETVNVTVTAMLEEMENNSRAEKATVDMLYYAVYVHSSTVINEPTILDLTPTRICGSTQTKNDEGQFTLSVDLVKNQKYNIVFWAQGSTCDGFIRGENLRTVKVDYTKDVTDAFYGQTGVIDTKNTKTATVILSRPFALLNVCASDAYEYAQSNKITKAEATVSEYADELNLLDGTKNTVNEPCKITSIWENGLVVNEGSNNLVSAFILPTGNDVTLTVKVNGGRAEGGEELSVPNCPLNANYKTNIDGNWLMK